MSLSQPKKATKVAAKKTAKIAGAKGQTQKKAAKKLVRARARASSVDALIARTPGKSNRSIDKSNASLSFAHVFEHLRDTYNVAAKAAEEGRLIPGAELLAGLLGRARAAHNSKIWANGRLTEKEFDRLSCDLADIIALAMLLADITDDEMAARAKDAKADTTTLH